MDFLFIYGYGCTLVFGSALIGIGITAYNPEYENTKSPVYQTNVMVGMNLAMMASFSPLLLFVVGHLLFRVSVEGLLIQAIGQGLTTGVMLTMAPILVTTIGAIMVGLGIRKLSRPAF